MSNNKDKILYKLAVRKIHVHKCPILLYDWERIRNNIIDCESIFRELNVKFLFPVKAFPYHKFLYNIAKMNMGFDVSQYSEYKLIKELITEETIVSFSSPSLCLDKIKKNIMGKHIIFYNSLNGINSKNKDKLFIRINITNIGLKFSHFGVDMINLNKENILGIHIHIPQDYKTNVFWKNIIQIIRTLKKDYVNLRYLNLGGGWNENERYSLKLIIKQTNKMFENKLIIMLEPDELFFRGAGYLITKVIGYNCYGNKNIVYINSCKDAHSKWSKPIWLSSNYDVSDTSLVLCGSSCSENDIFSLEKTSYLPQYGELIVFSNITPYSWAWNHSFNGIGCARMCFYE